MQRPILLCVAVLLLCLGQDLWAMPTTGGTGAGRESLPSEDEDVIRGFLSGRLEMDVPEESVTNKRMGRRETLMGIRHSHCNRLSQPWLAVTATNAFLANSVSYKVMVTTASTEPPWKVFPLWHLMMFMKRFYGCCKHGYGCRKIKGYQGRLMGHKQNNVEFFLRPEYLKLNVVRAQLHLEIANPDKVTVEADVRARLQGLSVSKNTRNFMWHKRESSELAVDVMFLFKMMKEVHAEQGGGNTEFILILKCSEEGGPVSCGEHGVSVLRAPFMAIGYT
uniref:Uncharacterized protein n=1 Tax=Callorhinchus milii TaxID=7868 RepID=V9L3Z1_CALMI